MIEMIISAIILSSVFQYAVINIINKKINKYKLLKAIIIYAIVLVLSYQFMNVIRIFISLIVISIINSILYKEKMSKSIIVSFLVFFIFALSEIIILLVLMLVSSTNVLEHYYGRLFINVAVSIIFVSIIKLPSLIRIISSRVEIIGKNFDKRFYFFFIAVFFNFALLIHYIYFEGSKLTHIALYVASIIMIVVLFINLINSKNQKELLFQKHIELSNTITEYETHLDSLRYINHENKNNLIVIRDCSSEFLVKEKINSILGSKDPYCDDEILKLPSGGVRGIVAHTIEVCNKNNIKLDLFVDKIKVSKKDDLSKLLGIYLDNAIEASLTTDYPEILIGFYSEEITISNTYSGYIDVSSIKAKGYSTKGKDRGYGLFLADDILKSSGIQVIHEINDYYKIKIKSF